MKAGNLDFFRFFFLISQSFRKYHENTKKCPIIDIFDERAISMNHFDVLNCFKQIDDED